MALQMNGGSGAGLQSEINVTPLVDVVLVLLIIFMVVVPLMMEGYDVDTPRASSAATPESEVSQVILRVEPATCGILAPPAGDGLPADCRVNLAEREIPAAEVPARVAELLGGRPKDQRILFLAADDRLNYEGVLRIVDLAKSQVDDLKIGVITTE
jgi:biopolymer transport protein ExbD